MSPKLLEVLENAGWYRGRSRSSIDFVKALKGKGFEVHRAAQDFHSEFEGLDISLGNYPGSPRLRVQYEDVPERRMIRPVEELDRELGPLVPVALEAASPMLYFLMMAPDGRVFEFNDGLIGDPDFDYVVWGPWPGGVSAH